MTRKIILKQFSGIYLFLCFFVLVNAQAQAPCTTTTITSFLPASGPEGTVVTLTGVGFNVGAGTTTVKFNGTASTSFTVVSDSQLTAVVPTGATTGLVQVITNGCQATGTTFTVLQTNCTTTVPELYISELYDHVPGSYGVIELYNPSPTNTITFNGEYVLERYGDIGGATPSNTLILPGSVGPESTYLVLTYGTGEMGCSVITNASMGSGINDNDEFKLKKNSVVIDIAHAPDETGYSVIRKPDAVAPNTTYNDNDWNFFSTQSCTDLGSHTATPQAVAVTVTTQPQDDTACIGTQATFTTVLSDTTGATYQWKTLNSSGVWVNVTGSNSTGTTTATLTVSNVTAAQNATQYYCQVTTPACTVITNAVQLTVPATPVAATTTQVQPTCTTTTGTITVTAPLGNEYQYNLNGGAYQAATTFAGLAPGSYTLTVQNTAGCTSPATTIVINAVPAAPAIATTTQVQPTCTVPTGSITIATPIGTEYQYSLNSGAYQSTTTFAGLAPGSYTITVQNTAGCTSVTAPIVINAVPAAPAVATTTQVQPDCTTPTGSITVTTPTGTAYQYSLNGGAYQSATTFAGLAPGSYTITVQNTGGCTSVTAPIVINTVPNAPDVATTTLTQPDCTTTTGSIVVTAPLGTDYQYSLNGGTYQSDVNFTNLAPGSYTITVQNFAGCTSITAPIVINAVPNAPDVATTTQTQPDCTTATGSITVTAPLGTDYQYSLNGGTYQSEVNFTNLAPGSYTITVQNFAGCTSVTAPIVINAAPVAPIVATTTLIQPSCTTPTGSIAVTAPLGTDYQYSLNGGTYQSDVNFTNLAPGSYVITVMSISGCTSATGPIVINTVPNAPIVATTTQTQPDCTTATGSITVTAPLGTAYQYSLNGGAYQSAVTFTGLAAGSYTITVQNTAGCTSVTAPIVINAAPAAPAIATTVVSQPDCITTTGSIAVTAPLGSGYQYSLNGGAYQASATFANLIPGSSYTITVQNTLGCTSVTAPIVINTLPAAPEVTGTQDCTPTINGNNYVLQGLPLNNSFDANDVTYEWRLAGTQSVLGDGVTFNVTEYTTDTTVFPLQFELTVTTEGGCTGTYLFTVDGIFCDIPRGISPNDDDKNDRFDLTGMNVRHLSIFNRYGLEVYKKSNYNNEWFGQTDSGDDLPTGTYFYVIKLAEGSKTGWVYINRPN